MRPERPALPSLSPWEKRYAGVVGTVLLVAPIASAPLRLPEPVAIVLAILGAAILCIGLGLSLSRIKFPAGGELVFARPAKKKSSSRRKTRPPAKPQPLQPPASNRPARRAARTRRTTKPSDSDAGGSNDKRGPPQRPLPRTRNVYPLPMRTSGPVTRRGR